MPILGGTKAATSGAGYLWVKPSKQTGNWEASLHEDPHTTFFCTPHDASVVKDARV